MPRHRGNNEGMIRKRSDERWEARISLPDGTRKSFYGKTRQEVQGKLHKPSETSRADCLLSVGCRRLGSICFMA